MEDPELYKRLNAVLMQIGTLERKVDFLFKHLGVTYVDTRPPPDEIEKLLLEGNAVAASKLYLAKHRVGLLEAKRAIDEIKAKLGL
jgi:hypothetical protein